MDDDRSTSRFKVCNTDSSFASLSHDTRNISNPFAPPETLSNKLRTVSRDLDLSRTISIYLERSRSISNDLDPSREISIHLERYRSSSNVFDPTSSTRTSPSL